ncbi:MAG: hydroxymethylbilane synthase [Hydrotalea sp.]|nr:hydroxymethylbilane synthase [Hydrotalea sp.]MDI9314473.1 hydroxymethylbilane synthase [Hydrotalea sp.]
MPSIIIIKHLSFFIDKIYKSKMDERNKKSGDKIIIGSRASPLAMAQSNFIMAGLQAANPNLSIGIETMTTSGDKFLNDKLSAVGGKGLFTKELDAALLAGKIDLAVHSLKDVETKLSPGISIVAIPQRETPFDCFLSRDNRSLQAMPAGSKVGTASLRRQALLKKHRPDIKVVLLRGNINSRLEKLARGDIDGMVLALAGLKRINLANRVAQVFSAEDFPPAPAQGALAVVARTDDQAVKKMLEPLHHDISARAVMLERQFLAMLDGSCKTPIGCLVKIDGDNMIATGFVADEDLSNPRQKNIVGPVSDGENIMTSLAEMLRKKTSGEELA